ncbi:MAG: hypothetical protein RJQ08_07240 [Salinisphaeraceae bacterium]
MRKTKPHIGIQYLRKLPHKPIQEFAGEISHPNLEYLEDAQSEFGPYAGLEWLLPTAVVLYIGRPYFKAFLTEAGKDHYQILRTAVVKLSQKYIGKSVAKLHSISAGGKGGGATGTYSLIYSIIIELNQGLRFKLLIEEDLSPEQVELATAALLDCAKAFHNESELPVPIEGLKFVKPFSGTILINYNFESDHFVIIDPSSSKYASKG